MFCSCFELTPRDPITDGRTAQIMQHCPGVGCYCKLHCIYFRRDDVPFFSPGFRATRPPEQVPEGEQESDVETLRRSSDL